MTKSRRVLFACAVALAVAFCVPQLAFADEAAPAGGLPAGSDAPAAGQEPAGNPEGASAGAQDGADVPDAGPREAGMQEGAQDGAGQETPEDEGGAPEDVQERPDADADGADVADDPEGAGGSGGAGGGAPEGAVIYTVKSEPAQAVASRPGAASLSVRAHVQGRGWASPVAGGAVAGTTGRGLRLEALRISVAGMPGGVQYQLHVQRTGWQGVCSNGAVAGTTGRGLRVEAIRICLYGEVSRWYDVSYRAHVQKKGWMDWVSNGAIAGTTGQSLRVEALQVKLVEKGAGQQAVGIAGVRYRAHVQKKGWQGWTIDGASAGTTGKALRMEAVQVYLDRGAYPSGSISYRAHVQKKGWMGWVSNGAVAGTTGKSLRVEALQLSLSGAIANDYMVVYRAHVQKVGWQDWVSGGLVAGTTGRALRVEALQIRIIRKPTEVPVATRTVDDGLYLIRVNSAQGVAMSVASASDASGANVRLATTQGWALEEKWRITWKGNGYELVNANSGKVLEAADGTRNMVANLRQAARNNSLVQRWVMKKNANGSIGLYSPITGMQVYSDGGSVASGANLLLWTPSNARSQQYALTPTKPLEAGTYQVFTKLKQSGLAVDVPGGSVANGAQLKVSASNDGPNQHFIVASVGGRFSIQAVSSGKYLTVSGGRVVQSSKAVSGGQQAASQLWDAALSPNGGLVFVNAATGAALSVAGGKAASGTPLVAAASSGAAAQRWYVAGRSLVSNGLYELRSAASLGLVLDVKGASLKAGANSQVCSRNNGNNQKFLVMAVSGGYYRICMPFSNTAVTVAGSSKAGGANVRMEAYSGRAAQLWKPEVTDGGLRFVNRGSGLAFGAAAAKSGSNVAQAAASGSSLQRWSVVKTSLNTNDLTTYAAMVGIASGANSPAIANAVSGYKLNKSRWNALINAVNDCYNAGFDIGFVLVDAATGMTVSSRCDRTFYAASTVKGLYVTFLFEQYFEKGRLSPWDLAGLVEPTIVNSNNETYMALRARYGSEEEFRQWLKKVGVGYISTWDSYTPRSLAKVWTHMLSYSKSGGKYVGYWKSLFCQTYFSPIRYAIGDYRTTWTKPGWMGDNWNDAGVVTGGGHQYVLAVMSSSNPWANGWAVQNVIRALDSLAMTFPKSR